MATEVYHERWNTTGHVTFAPDSHVVVFPGATLYTGGGWAVLLGATGSSLQLFGTLMSDVNTLTMGFTGNLQTDMTLLVGRDGIVSTTSASNAAVSMIARDFRVANEGLMAANGYAFYVATDPTGPAGESSILNTGRIIGPYAAITSSAAPMIDTLRIENRGLIHSAFDAINLSSATGDITLVNTGTISGDVRLGSGADLFAGRGGTVDGPIAMGSGNDTVRPGAEAEEIDGGNGIDLIDFRGRTGVQVSLAGDLAGSGAAAGDSYQRFENVSGTRGADTVVGNTAANVLRGEAGADWLAGGAGNDKLVGGPGTDTLTGGVGNDVFQWSASTEGGDTVADFRNGADNDDRLLFAAAGFAGLSAGAPPAGAFIVRSDNVAQQADDRFVFRTADRTLWFDGDGNGAGAAVLIATFGGSTVPTSADFSVY
jgi:Ca2+-binding RTX toxin-like protein